MSRRLLLVQAIRQIQAAVAPFLPPDDGDISSLGGDDDLDEEDLAELDRLGSSFLSPANNPDGSEGSVGTTDGGKAARHLALLTLTKRVATKQATKQAKKRLVKLPSSVETQGAPAGGRSGGELGKLQAEAERLRAST